MAPKDEQLRPFNHPLNGRLITKLDGTLVPDAHFQILENLRYNDGGIEPVLGMTPVSIQFDGNIVNGFHFKKSYPIEEDHVFIQAVDPDTNESIIFKSVASDSAPNLGQYTEFIRLVGSDGSPSTTGNVAYFSNAPDHSMVFCDGVKNYIWSGDESRVSAAINDDQGGAFSNDITAAMSNSLSNDNNVAVLRPQTSSVSAETVLLIHADQAEGTAGTDILDSSSSAKTLTAQGGAKVVEGLAGKFGSGFGKMTASAIATCSMSNSYLLLPPFVTIEAWVKVAEQPDASKSGVIFQSSSGADSLTVSYSFESDALWLKVTAVAGATTQRVFFPQTIPVGEWVHIAFEKTLIPYVMGGTPVYAMFCNGVYLGASAITADVTFSAPGVCGNAGGIVFEGIDEFRFSSTRRYVTGANFTPSAVPFAVDEYTKGLYHFDDVGASPTVDSAGLGEGTFTGTFSIAASIMPQVGTGALYFDGSGDYITTPDSADWDFGSGDFTISCWVNIPSAINFYRGICGQYADAANLFAFYINIGLGTLTLTAKGAGTDVAAVGSYAFAANTWHHVEVGRSGSNMYMFADGVPLTITGTPIGSQPMPNVAAVLEIGAANNHSTMMTGMIDELIIKKGEISHTTAFNPSVVPYGSSSVTSLLIGALRPISGVKFYLHVPNTAESSVNAFYWTGSGWGLVSSLIDGTSDAGVTLAQDGFVRFSPTVGIAKPKVVNENFAYFYYVNFTGIDATTALKQITVYADAQPVVDIWDGVPRTLFSFIKDTGVYADLTQNTYSLNYFDGETDTYADVSALTDVQRLYVGFAERVTGIKIYFAATNVNTNAADISIDYWDGSQWVSVGAIVDGTEVDSKSGNRTGVVSWNAPESSQEFPRTVGNSSKWFYYAIGFSATLSATVYIDSVSGIPVQKEIRPHRFPVLWQNRLFFLNDQASNRHTCIGSSYGTNCVFNGLDAGMLIFGSSKEINSGQTIFTRYGGNLYENLIVCKSNETYLVDGTSFGGGESGQGAFVVYQVSSTRGCIAPLSMQQCDTGYEVAPGITKHVLAWLSNSGAVMFDSNSIIEISNDIKDKIDAIASAKSSTAAGFYDATRGEFHLIIPVGATLQEWVYDVVRKKWFSMPRGAKYLTCGFTVEDSQGNQYVYGGGDGYIQRLEYGPTFDGEPIGYKFRTPDSLMNSSWAERKEIRQIRLVGRCKSLTPEKIAISHYGDCSDTPSVPAINPISCNKDGFRIYKFARSISCRGTTNSFEFSISTDNEPDGGFYPLFISGLFRAIDLDVEEK